MIVHLLELRKRLIITLVIFAALFILFFFYANSLFDVLIHPLILSLSSNNNLISTQILAAAYTPLYIAFTCALIATSPIGLVQLWCFVKPGLYKKEYGFFKLCLLSSLIFFFLGIVFAYFVILPLLFAFLVKALPSSVQLMPDMANSAAFILRMLLIFGFLFQIPILFLIVTRLNLITIKALVALRPYFIVLAFILGMLLTPPDVISQIIVALPLWGLFEVGILMARIKS